MKIIASLYYKYYIFLSINFILGDSKLIKFGQFYANVTRAYFKWWKLWYSDTKLFKFSILLHNNIAYIVRIQFILSAKHTFNVIVESIEIITHWIHQRSDRNCTTTVHALSISFCSRVFHQYPIIHRNSLYFLVAWRHHNVNVVNNVGLIGVLRTSEIYFLLFSRLRIISRARFLV